MKQLLSLSALILAMVPLHGHAQGTSTVVSVTDAAQQEWVKTAAKRQQELIALNGQGTNPELTAQLLAMAKVDQGVRAELIAKLSQGGQAPDTQNQAAVVTLRQTDTKLTDQLKDVVSRDGWPTIHLVGFEASDAAMLILIHSPDHLWQEKLIPELEVLATQNKINGSQLATMVDKYLVANGRLQRYGTQFKLVSGHMAMYAVEDREGLDQRRAAAMLPPLNFYKQMLTTMYKAPVSDETISASDMAH